MTTATVAVISAFALIVLFAFILLLFLYKCLIRISELERAIEKVTSARLDDLCWMDLYELAAIAHVPLPDLTMLPREVMLSNCIRYIDCLAKCPADRDEAERIYRSRTIN